ncbi:translation initiation factor eIF-2B subunit alpha isoform X1 [Anoplopoma fimbria]|uniref:translation initiation factor eIF-2B subunit alpha isoform X1 n=1 Tax=Anoplopoma fimbria TaxID=229290 RepID=UPI0023EA8BD1|nr:translation initiation factor eIF-2B subunit alpha isoform X1 [Anoplopoma fimbria]XP_054468303.1 translation initiation factor eIF-2B subunit alpha isoform X1 [Anoplopoma fimbria]
MNEEELVEYFRAQMRKDPDMASAVAAIRTLLEFLKRDKGETILGLRESLKWATDCLTGVDSSVAVSSGGELFLRFISLTSLEHQDLSRCKKVMEERGELFLEKISMSRTKVAKLCHTFIKDGAKILTHSYSRVVLRVLEKAAGEKKRFSVYVTESQPDSAGRQMADALRKLNVPVTVVLDAAVGYVLEKVDLVIVGAEGVVESGGIINKIGTYQTAVCSKAHNKPFYVVAESFKFVRLYPLNQQDVPDKFKVRTTDDFTSRTCFVLSCSIFFTDVLPASTVQSRHPEERPEPVGGAPDDRLHASIPHHPPLHRPGSPHPVGRQRRAHQALFITQ